MTEADLGKSTAIRDADGVDPVLASVVAEREASRRATAPARVEQPRILPVDVAEGLTSGLMIRERPRSNSTRSSGLPASRVSRRLSTTELG